jgi:hypothetical protein
LINVKKCKTNSKKDDYWKINSKRTEKRTIILPSGFRKIEKRTKFRWNFSQLQDSSVLVHIKFERLQEEADNEERSQGSSGMRKLWRREQMVIA